MKCLNTLFERANFVSTKHLLILIELIADKPTGFVQLLDQNCRSVSTS